MPEDRFASLAPFVGESRAKLVDGLVEMFDDVSSDGGALWVSLEAQPGWGKTRAGREFYARLASRQEQPARRRGRLFRRQQPGRYWPPEINDIRRKVVVPTGTREARSLPEFMWWGVSCVDTGDTDSDRMAVR